MRREFVIGLVSVLCGVTVCFCLAMWDINRRFEKYHAAHENDKKELIQSIKSLRQDLGSLKSERKTLDSLFILKKK